MPALDFYFLNAAFSVQRLLHSGNGGHRFTVHPQHNFFTIGYTRQNAARMVRAELDLPVVEVLPI